MESPRPLYRILVMSDGNNRFAMQFCEGTDIYELKAGEAIGNYVESLNKKDSDAFIVCYENVESESVNSFIESVKSCKETSSELFWRDQSREETVIKVHRTLISEDGKQMGSYGTGKVDCTDYWLVKLIDGESRKSFVNTDILAILFRSWACTRSLKIMKKTTLSISCLALLLLSSFLTACGGQHNTNHVHAIDLIRDRQHHLIGIMRLVGKIIFYQQFGGRLGR